MSSSVPGEKRAALLAEVTRLRDERGSASEEPAAADGDYISQQPCRGTVSIGNVQLPLKVEFVCSSRNRKGMAPRNHHPVKLIVGVGVSSFSLHSILSYSSSLLLKHSQWLSRLYLYSIYSSQCCGMLRSLVWAFPTSGGLFSVNNDRCKGK